MRRFWCTIPAAVLAGSVFAGVAQGQVSGLDIGAMAGVNIANWGGDDADASSRADFFVGLSLVYPLTDMLAIQPEIAYSRKGAKEEGGDGEHKMAYVDVPILLKIMPGAAGQARPALFLGPMVAFNVSCDSDGGDCKEFTNSIDMALVGGAGLDLGALGLFARYQFGLPDIADTTGPTPDIKNRVIQLGGRWSFRRSEVAASRRRSRPASRPRAPAWCA